MLLSPSIKVYLLLSVFIPFPITAIATLAPHAFSQRAKPGGGDCQAKPPINGPQASAVQPGYSWPTGDHEYMMIHVWILYIYVYINTCNYIYACYAYNVWCIIFVLTMILTIFDERTKEVPSSPYSS